MDRSVEDLRTLRLRSLMLVIEGRGGSNLGN